MVALEEKLNKLSNLQNTSNSTYSIYCTPQTLVIIETLTATALVNRYTIIDLQ
ncbi:MAG: hypothetical protein KME30_09155 [Iphinoe sp. HA4291-MV1]|jgi:hypothetical protein|nr:hypothetical protein [Iphinoe sp. HA4291-MV1]